MDKDVKWSLMMIIIGFSLIILFINYCVTRCDYYDGCFEKAVTEHGYCTKHEKEMRRYFID